MHRYFYVITLATFALACGSYAAQSADLPIKTRPRVLLSYQGCGTFYGIHTVGSAARVDATGQPGSIGTPYLANGAVGANLGYLCGDGTAWKAVEVLVHYSSVASSVPATDQAVVGSVGSRWGATGRFMLGGPIAGMLSLLPNMSTVFPALPAAPVGVIGASHPYLFGAVHFDDVQGSLGIIDGRSTRLRAGFGVGLMSELGQAQNMPGGSRVVANTWVEYIPAAKGIDLGGAGLTGTANPGNEVRIGFGLNY